jgi:GNAT superfamily N-acetyltransferase
MIEFVPLDLDRDRKTLVDLNEEYLTWIRQKTFEEYNVDYFSEANITIRQYAENTIDEFSEYKPPKGICYLLKLGNDIVGMGTLRKLSDTIGEIKRMYVKPKYRRRGIGKRLLHQLLKKGEEFNFSTIRLDTGRFMTNAHELYKRAGFIEIEAYPESEIPTEYRHLSVFMEKKLS